MIIKGKYSQAEILTNSPDFHSIEQLKLLCNQKILKDSIIKVMPDICPGIPIPIGTTVILKNTIMPSLVSGDIGCGVLCCKLKDKNIEYQKLDKIIKENIIKNKTIKQDFDLNKLYCLKYIDKERALLSLGTLGNGNHFIEIDMDDEKNKYLIIHSGSRILGNQVHEYYLNQGYKKLKDIDGFNRLFTYLENDLYENYIHDIQIVQNFAKENRRIISNIICKSLKNKIVSEVESIHNYIDFEEDNIIIRKGAISAKNNESVIIPINMRDGCILGQGKGNIYWNNSAPHGAGRLFSRSEVDNHFTLNEFKKEMKGIYSSCINKSTLDESPMAYKDLIYISENIKDTVDILKIIKPIYVFKNSN